MTSDAYISKNDTPLEEIPFPLLISCSSKWDVSQFIYYMPVVIVANMCIKTGILLLQLVVLAVAQGNGSYSVKTPPLTTNWTYEVGTNPWPEYPRPQLQRSQCKLPPSEIHSVSSKYLDQRLFRVHDSQLLGTGC